MTTKTFAAEPANNTFAVWFDANNDPYFTYYREDAHSNGYDHWFNADQHDTGDDDDPKTWAELCDEAYGMRGPVLLVPADLLTQSREQAATHANEIGTLTAENARVRQQRDGQAAVIEAAKAWRDQFSKAPITKGPRMAALMDAVDALPKAEATR